MTNAELLAKIKAEIERISSRAMNEEGQDLCEYLLSFISSIEEKLEKLSAERDKDMIVSIEMWLHEIEPKWVEKELAWLDELRTRLLEEEPEKPVNPEDAMKELDEKIALVKQRGTWDGVDVDKYMDEVRGRESEKPMQNGLEEEISRTYHNGSVADTSDIDHVTYEDVARHFYDLGCRRTAEKYDEIEYNRQRAEESVPKDLEEYASRAGFDYVDNIVQEHPGHRFNDHDVEYAYRDAFIAGAKWQEDHTPLPEDTVLFNKGVEEGKRLAEEEQADMFTIVALDAAQRAKEKMMKEAVEGRVQTSPLNGPLGISAYCCNFPPKHPFYHCKVGDKVRIIIIKED